MQTKGITFKGTTDGLAIIVPEGAQVETVLKEVGEKIQSAARFFKGATLRVTYRGITLSATEEEALLQILKEHSGATIASLSAAKPSPETASAPYGPNTNASPQPPPAQPLRRFFSKGQDESDCKFIRNTLRGGTRIQYDGSVVVVGDVNPGAEIVAGGNVIVLGLLRGMVHAGANGARDAFISALKLVPTQLRIADLIARCPDDPDAPGCYPEIASVRDGLIEVAPLYDRMS